MRSKYRLFAALAVTLAALFTVPTPTARAEAPPRPASVSADTVYTVPADIPADCSVDVSAQLNAFIASVPDGAAGAGGVSYSVIRFKAGGCYLVEGILRVTDRNRLIFEGPGGMLPNAKFRRDTFMQGAPASIWRFEAGSNLIVRDLKVDGTAPLHQYDPNKVQEHAFGVYGVQTFTADAVKVTEVWGDCLTDHFDHRQNPPLAPSNVTFKNSTCDSRRQGVSHIAGDGFYILNNNFLPGPKFAHVDLEPDTGNQQMTNMVIDGNFFDNDEGFQIAALISISGCNAANVTITNNTNAAQESGSNGGVIAAQWTGADCRQDGLTVSGNTWHNYNGQPFISTRRWDNVTVSNNEFIADFGPPPGPWYVLKLEDTCHVWYSGNSITGPNAPYWFPETHDDLSCDINVS